MEGVRSFFSENLNPMKYWQEGNFPAAVVTVLFYATIVPFVATFVGLVISECLFGRVSKTNIPESADPTNDVGTTTLNVKNKNPQVKVKSEKDRIAYDKLFLRNIGGLNMSSTSEGACKELLRLLKEGYQINPRDMSDLITFLHYRSFSKNAAKVILEAIKGKNCVLNSDHLKALIGFLNYTTSSLFAAEILLLAMDNKSIITSSHLEKLIEYLNDSTSTNNATTVILKAIAKGVAFGPNERRCLTKVASYSTAKANVEKIREAIDIPVVKTKVVNPLEVKNRNSRPKEISAKDRETYNKLIKENIDNLNYSTSSDNACKELLNLLKEGCEINCKHMGDLIGLLNYSTSSANATKVILQAMEGGNGYINSVHLKSLIGHLIFSTATNNATSVILKAIAQGVAFGPDERLSLTNQAGYSTAKANVEKIREAIAQRS